MGAAGTAPGSLEQPGACSPAEGSRMGLGQEGGALGEGGCELSGAPERVREGCAGGGAGGRSGCACCPAGGAALLLLYRPHRLLPSAAPACRERSRS